MITPNLFLAPLFPYVMSFLAQNILLFVLLLQAPQTRHISMLRNIPLTPSLIPKWQMYLTPSINFQTTIRSAQSPRFPT